VTLKFFRLIGDYPYPGSEEVPTSTLEPIKNLFKYIWRKICSLFSYLTPGNIRKQWHSMKEKTYFELFIGFFKLSFGSFFMGGWYMYHINKVIFKFILKLMTGEPIVGSLDEEDYDEKALVPMISGGFTSLDANGAPRMAIMSAEEVDDREDVDKVEKEVITTDEKALESMSSFHNY
jgi:hypothetical protein